MYYVRHIMQLEAVTVFQVKFGKALQLLYLIIVLLIGTFLYYLFYHHTCTCSQQIPSMNRQQCDIHIQVRNICVSLYNTNHRINGHMCFSIRIRYTAGLSFVCPQHLYL